MENCCSLGPDPSTITEECWVFAEEATEEVLNCVHPTLDTEEKRKDVFDYVQRLIKFSLGCEVFAYGSVPLKTYLPDGDIDLTLCSSPSIEETLARDVLAVLQEEELKENTEYDIKYPQFIDAEVKIVKCLVQNTVVDISFNQLGGLCTLCFLEQVDRMVGKGHLFKRSIILIKAWCYYESRILGAPHGLISTYALETLVLFIFHMFHSSLNGPLAVLYRFLDYYSKFDWDNYCISLNGPVCKSPLPGFLTEMPEYKSDDLLLDQEFLTNCAEMFSVPSRGLETDARVFQQKYLNIIDPLKENNNLGRSVGRGNASRIQRAFRFGARKLGEILSASPDKVADEINKFFRNTRNSVVRHNHFADFQDCGLTFGDDQDTHSSLSPAEFKSDTPKRVSKSVISNQLYGSFSNGHDNSGQNDLDCGLGVETEDEELFCSDGSEISSPKTSILESLSLDIEESDFAMDPLADLTGEYDSHIRSLLYGQWCYGFASSAPVVPRGGLSPPSRCQNQNFWDNVRQSMPLRQQSFCRTNGNGVHVGPTVHRSDKSLPSAATFGSEEKEMSQGTGYFLNTERHYRGRTRNRTPRSHNQLHLHIGTDSNGWVPAFSVENCLEKCTNEVSAVPAPVPSHSDNLVTHSHVERIVFGSLGNLPEDVLSCTSSDVPQKVQLPEPVCSKQESLSFRVVEHSLRLKNEDEFPPLPLQKV